MAIEKDAVSDQLQVWILDAYAGLDLDDVATATAPLIAKSDALGTVVKNLRSDVKNLRKKRDKLAACLTSGFCAA